MLGITTKKNLYSLFKLEFWILLWPTKAQYSIYMKRLVHVNTNIDFLKLCSIEA